MSLGPYQKLPRVAPPDGMDTFHKVFSWGAPSLFFGLVIALAFAGSTHSIEGTDTSSFMGHGHVGDEPDILNPNAHLT